MDNPQPQNSTNQPAGQNNQQFWQPSPAASTNLDPLTQPSVLTASPSTFPAAVSTPAPVTPAAPADISATPPPAVTPDPAPISQPTPPAQDTFAPTPPPPPSASVAVTDIAPPTALPAPISGDRSSIAQPTSTEPIKSIVFSDEDEDIISQDILDLLGTKDLSDQDKADFYQKMVDTIENRVIGRIADQMTDEEQQEWNKIGEAQDKQKMDDFLDLKKIDISQLMLQETLTYKAKMAALAQPIKDAASKINSQPTANQSE